MTDPVTLLVTVATALGVIDVGAYHVERSACEAQRAAMERDSAGHIAHDPAMRGWTVRVSECGTGAVLPAHAEGLGR